jgi:uncharacterized protein (DUF302 family)
MSNKKQHNPPDGNYRCERCWSEKNINLFPRSQFVDDAKGFVILCEKCKSESPSEKDEKIFDNLFLRFASPKEFIQYYNVENEKEAKELWNQERDGKELVFDNTPKDSTNDGERVGIGEKKTHIGYEVIDDALIINQGQAELVKEIFKSYLTGKTMEKISRDLKKKGAKIFSLNEVREILKDPTYAGYKFRGTEIIKAEHDAIIDPETFNKVQQKIVRNIRNPKYLYKPLELKD